MDWDAIDERRRRRERADKEHAEAIRLQQELERNRKHQEKRRDIVEARKLLFGSDGDRDSQSLNAALGLGRKYPNDPSEIPSAEKRPINVEYGINSGNTIAREKDSNIMDSMLAATKDTRRIDVQSAPHPWTGITTGSLSSGNANTGTSIPASNSAVSLSNSDLFRLQSQQNNLQNSLHALTKRLEMTERVAADFIQQGTSEIQSETARLRAQVAEMQQMQRNEESTLRNENLQIQADLQRLREHLERLGMRNKDDMEQLKKTTLDLETTQQNEEITLRNAEKALGMMHDRFQRSLREHAEKCHLSLNDMTARLEHESKERRLHLKNLENCQIEDRNLIANREKELIDRIDVIKSTVQLMAENDRRDKERMVEMWQTDLRNLEASFTETLSSERNRSLRESERLERLLAEEKDARNKLISDSKSANDETLRSIISSFNAKFTAFEAAQIQQRQDAILAVKKLQDSVALVEREAVIRMKSLEDILRAEVKSRMDSDQKWMQQNEQLSDSCANAKEKIRTEIVREMTDWKEQRSKEINTVVNRLEKSSEAKARAVSDLDARLQQLSQRHKETDSSLRKHMKDMNSIMDLVDEKQLKESATMRETMKTVQENTTLRLLQTERRVADAENRWVQAHSEMESKLAVRNTMLDQTLVAFKEDMAEKASRMEGLAVAEKVQSELRNAQSRLSELEEVAIHLRARWSETEGWMRDRQRDWSAMMELREKQDTEETLRWREAFRDEMDIRLKRNETRVAEDLAYQRRMQKDAERAVREVNERLAKWREECSTQVERRLEIHEWERIEDRWVQDKNRMQESLSQLLVQLEALRNRQDRLESAAEMTAKKYRVLESSSSSSSSAASLHLPRKEVNSILQNNTDTAKDHRRGREEADNNNVKDSVDDRKNRSNDNIKNDADTISTTEKMDLIQIKSLSNIARDEDVALKALKNEVVRCGKLVIRRLACIQGSLFQFLLVLFIEMDKKGSREASNESNVSPGNSSSQLMINNKQNSVTSSSKENFLAPKNASNEYISSTIPSLSHQHSALNASTHSSPHNKVSADSVTNLQKQAWKRSLQSISDAASLSAESRQNSITASGKNILNNDPKDHKMEEVKEEDEEEAGEQRRVVDNGNLIEKKKTEDDERKLLQTEKSKSENTVNESNSNPTQKSQGNLSTHSTDSEDVALMQLLQGRNRILNQQTHLYMQRLVDTSQADADRLFLFNHHCLARLERSFLQMVDSAATVSSSSSSSNSAAAASKSEITDSASIISVSTNAFSIRFEGFALYVGDLIQEWLQEARACFISSQGGNDDKVRELSSPSALSVVHECLLRAWKKLASALDSWRNQLQKDFGAEISPAIWELSAGALSEADHQLLPSPRSDQDAEIEPCDGIYEHLPVLREIVNGNQLEASANMKVSSASEQAIVLEVSRLWKAFLSRFNDMSIQIEQLQAYNLTTAFITGIQSENPSRSRNRSNHDGPAMSVSEANLKSPASGNEVAPSLPNQAVVPESNGGFLVELQGIKSTERMNNPTSNTSNLNRDPIKPLAASHPITQATVSESDSESNSNHSNHQPEAHLELEGKGDADSHVNDSKNKPSGDSDVHDTGTEAEWMPATAFKPAHLSFKLNAAEQEEDDDDESR